MILKILTRLRKKMEKPRGIIFTEFDKLTT